MVSKSKKIRHMKRLKIEEKKIQEIQTKNEINPFEIRHNKIKHKILGRKIAKNEFGKPLINRNRAFKKREQTLLEEYKNKDKSGKGLQDTREQNPEQRIIAKFKEEQNQISLNNNEIVKLTHKGKPLEEVMGDNLSDDEDIDLFNRDDYVETSHFGGGNNGPPRSKKDILNEILEEKLQQKIDREETILLTEKLDNDWNKLKNLIQHQGSNRIENSFKQNHEEYDSLIKQLVFDEQNIIKENNVPSPISTMEQNLSQTPDAMFKNKFKTIDTSNDIAQITKNIKGIIELLPKITRKSFVILKERLKKLGLKKLKFTPNEMATLIIAAHFKELQVLIHLKVMKTLNHIKYSTLNEVACVIFLSNFLLKTISKEKFYSELFIHLDNLICLCLPQEKTKLRLFHRMRYETECILNVSKIVNIPKGDLNYKVTLNNLFGDIFKNGEIAVYNLAFQVFILLSNFYDKYYSSSGICFMLLPTINKINSHLIPAKMPEQMKIFLKDLINRFQFNASSRSINTKKSVVQYNKPSILPMLEPKFEEDFKIKSKITGRKKLLKKYKREFKGAQREIRKDAKFLRDVYLKEIDKKDRIRKQKVKEILRDLSLQQGLYKKKK